MSTTNQNKPICEIALIAVLEKLIIAGILTVADLFSAEGLLAELVNAVRNWVLHVGARQSKVVSCVYAIGADRENPVNSILEMGDNIISHIFWCGERSDNPYPALTNLLERIHQNGASSGPAYLVTVCKNYALDEVKRALKRKARMGNLYGYNSDGDYGILDPGTTQDHDVIDPDEKLIYRESMDLFLSECGKDFARDLVFLAARVAGLSRKTITSFFYRNDVTELVLLVVSRVRNALDHDISEQLALLLEQSKTYRVPERHRNNPESLENFLYRQTGKAGEDRFWRLWESCNQ